MSDIPAPFTEQGEPTAIYQDWFAMCVACGWKSPEHFIERDKAMEGAAPPHIHLN